MALVRGETVRACVSVCLVEMMLALLCFCSLCFKRRDGAAEAGLKIDRFVVVADVADRARQGEDKGGGRGGDVGRQPAGCVAVAAVGGGELGQRNGTWKV